MHRISNVGIRRRMKAEGDMLEYGDNRVINRVAKKSTIGRRKRGRPRRSWWNKVDDITEISGLEVGYWGNRDRSRLWIKEEGQW